VENNPKLAGYNLYSGKTSFFCDFHLLSLTYLFIVFTIYSVFLMPRLQCFSEHESIYNVFALSVYASSHIIRHATKKV